jgi:hypothetical protein
MGLEKEQDEDVWRDRLLSDLLQVKKCRIRYVQFDRLGRYSLDEYDKSSVDFEVTCDMNVN